MTTVATKEKPDSPWENWEESHGHIRCFMREHLVSCWPKVSLPIENEDLVESHAAWSAALGGYFEMDARNIRKPFVGIARTCYCRRCKAAVVTQVPSMTDAEWEEEQKRMRERGVVQPDRALTEYFRSARKRY